MAKTLVYQMYPIAWEGMSDETQNHKTPLERMTEHLRRVKELGCDYVWLNPFYCSPRCDHGYDISDYKSVDPAFGDFADLVLFIKEAHYHGLKVLFDLVLNHTSIEHPWFEEYPDYYCWASKAKKGWKNLFDGKSTWTFSPEKKQYYLHLFHKGQADLNWFPGGELNQDLVREFRDIVRYWTELYDVDGFRLDAPQALNKDFSKKNLQLEDLLFGNQAVEVLNAVFDGFGSLFLMMECLDPTNGEIVSYYADNTPVDYVLDVTLKDEILTGPDHLIKAISELSKNPSYMLDLESHDSPRFVSRNESLSPEDVIWWMFNSPAQAICLYQGQELGLRNPSKEELPDERMLKLDAQTAMRASAGENLDTLRPTSRANARVPIPLKEYARQEYDGDSYLNLTKTWIKRWKYDF